MIFGVKKRHFVISTKYRNDGDSIEEQFFAQSPGCFYWVLMNRDVFEGSRRKTYASQQSLVAAHARRTGIPYALPSALEAVTVALPHYVCGVECLYADDPWGPPRSANS
jgi:hypothetical protein